MLEPEEPVLIKYEEIPLTDESYIESRPGTSKSEDSDSSTDSDEEENILELLKGEGASEDDSFMEDPDRAEALREETTGRTLDCIFLP
ncbi:hypothetical protein TNIN_186321, partial [Trichonephila inaurata madagascariensis]